MSTDITSIEAPAPAPAGLTPTTPPATLCLHGGVETTDPFRGLVPPLHQSTTFAQDGVGQDAGYTYSRTGNPTVSVLEQRLGALEGALPALCFRTGMAAITATCLSLLESGDRVVVSDVVYGGTTRLLRQVLARFGIETVAVDTADQEALRLALRTPTRLVLVETPANPTLKLTDLAATAALCREAGAWCAVDNTFLTAVAQRPLDLGADLVLYSTTKYLDGHNTSVGGAVLTRDAELRERIEFVRGTTGNIQAPFEARLTARGLDTLPLRLERQSASAATLAAWLRDLPEVTRVQYPFLEGWPQEELARRQQTVGGAMLAFELADGAPQAERFLARTRIATLAENLGAGVTLLTHPATMTHASTPVAERRAVGIADGLIRVSVGLEEVSCLQEDFAEALR